MAIDMNHKAIKQMKEVLGASPRPAEKSAALPVRHGKPARQGEDGRGQTAYNNERFAA